MQTSSQPAVKLVLRLPAQVKERLAEVALTNHRSMNSEILSILERALAAAEQPNTQTSPSQ